jgi:hypothetical protein
MQAIRDIVVKEGVALLDRRRCTLPRMGESKLTKPG